MIDYSAEFCNSSIDNAKTETMRKIDADIYAPRCNLSIMRIAITNL